MRKVNGHILRNEPDANGVITEPDGRQFMQFEGGEVVACTGYIGQTRIGYMCPIDFETELGNAYPGKYPVYPTLEALCQSNPGCTKESGYVKVLMVALDFGKLAEDTAAEAAAEG